MHTIIHPLKPVSRSRRPDRSSQGPFRSPHFDCQELSEAVKLTVYVPGVEAAGVEITTRGPDITVTARKSHFVRVNWQALHLESAQRDYQLRLRLGRGLAYDALHAEIRNGVLTVVLPKKQPLVTDDELRQQRVA
ncbi:MAG TPA: Hsp20/alpha crystallin family protein [Opitutaceae bacterium]